MKLLFKFQKAILYLFLAAAVIVFIASLAYFTNFVKLKPTDSNSMWKFVSGDINDLANVDLQLATKEEYNTVVKVYDDLQSLNTWLFYLAVLVVVFVVILFIVGNSYRKKYYLTNLILGIVFPLISSILGIVVFAQNTSLISDVRKNRLLFLQVSKNYDYKISLTQSANSYAGYMIFANVALVIYIIVSILVIVYTILKYLSRNKVYSEKEGA